MFLCTTYSNSNVEKKKMLILALVLFIVIIAIVVLVNEQIKSLASKIDELPQGDAAVNSMNETERIFLTKLQRINAGMTESDIINILGPPRKEGVEIAGKKIPEWYPENDFSSGVVRIKIQNNQVYQIQWLKLNTFYWEKNFTS